MIQRCIRIGIHVCQHLHTKGLLWSMRFYWGRLRTVLYSRLVYLIVRGDALTYNESIVYHRRNESSKKRERFSAAGKMGASGCHVQGTLAIKEARC